MVLLLFIHLKSGKAYGETYILTKCFTSGSQGILERKKKKNEFAVPSSRISLPFPEKFGSKEMMICVGCNKGQGNSAA